MPSTFLNHTIRTENWNNIPLPLTDAVELFKKGFENVTSIVYAMLSVHKRKSDMIVGKFRAMDKAERV